MLSTDGAAPAASFRLCQPQRSRLAATPDPALRDAKWLAGQHLELGTGGGRITWASAARSRRHRGGWHHFWWASHLVRWYRH